MHLGGLHLGEDSRVLMIPQARFEYLAYVHNARGREHHLAKAHVKDGKCITSKMIHLRVNEIEPMDPVLDLDVIATIGGHCPEPPITWTLNG